MKGKNHCFIYGFGFRGEEEGPINILLSVLSGADFKLLIVMVWRSGGLFWGMTFPWFTVVTTWVDHVHNNEQGHGSLGKGYCKDRGGKTSACIVLNLDLLATDHLENSEDRQ